MSDESEASYWAILEPIWTEQPYADEVFGDWFNKLSEAQKVLFPTHWLVAEVQNGGFHQYFTNSTGFHAPEAILGLRMLELGDFAEVVEKAVAIVGTPFPRQRARREEVLWPMWGKIGENEDPFDELNNRFYELLKIPGTPEFSSEDRFTVAADAYARRFLT
jgi:hypothetical protein